MKPKLAVPVSGTGSLLEAMILARLFSIDLVFADRQCRGVEIARSAEVPTVVMPRSFKKDQFDRRAYTLEVVKLLQTFAINLVAMAGYMTVFDPVMFEHYAGRVLNIHPSLLPLFKGDHAVADALNAGVKETGTTIHIATSELDGGPILAQEIVPILGGDTVETLHERIKKVERDLYPKVILRQLQALSV